MTTLLMAALVIFGAFGYSTLPVSDLPNVDFPTISVCASLPGADPDTMASAVASPLENQFSTIPGIDQMTSSSTPGHRPASPSSSPWTATSTAPPRTCRRRSRPRTAPAAQGAAAAAHLPQGQSGRPADHVHRDELGHACRRPKLDEYAETLLARQISTIDGVAQVRCSAPRKYAVRIQADPAALAARQIGIDTAGQRGRRRQCQPGHRRAERRRPGPPSSIPTASSTTPRNSATRSSPTAMARRCGWAMSRTCIDGLENPYGRQLVQRTSRAIVLAINRQPGSNTVEVIDTIKAVLPQFKASLPPARAAGRWCTTAARSSAPRSTMCRSRC